MAGSIKGIIVEIGGDTSGLQKALSKVNSATSSLSKELTGINRLLKLDPKNTELLSQKQAVLSENIETTKNKLNQLKDIYAQAIEAEKNGAKISEENWRALQKDIENTKIKLNKLLLEQDVWNVNGKKVEEFGDKIVKVSSKIDNLGSKFTTRFSLPIIALGTLGTKSAMEQEASMQQVEKIYGEASDTIKEFANNTALSYNMSSKSAYKYSQIFGNLIQSMTDDQTKNAQYTQDLLKASSVIASATGRTMEDVMDRIRSGLLGNTEAIEDLGVNVNVSLLESTDAFKRFAGDKSWNQLDFQTQQQIRLFGILEQTTKKYGDEVNVNTTSKVQKLTSKLENMGSKLSSKLLPIVDKWIDKADKWIDKLDDMDDATLDNIIRIGLFVAAAGPALKIFGKLGSGIGTVIKTTGQFSQAIAVVKTGAKSTSASVNSLASGIKGLISPFGIATLALSSFAVGISLVSKKVKEEAKETQSFIKSLEDSVNTRKNSIDIINEQQSANLAEIGNVQRLYSELNNLVESNGKVKEGYESRVKFILNQLNNALGTEYKLNNDIITSYNDMRLSVDKLIDKKRAQLILEANEEEYKEAIKNKTQATKDYIKTQDKLSEAIKNYNELNEDYKKGFVGSKYSIIEGELKLKEYKDQVEQLSSLYKEQKSQLQKYSEALVKFEKNSELMIEGTEESYKKIEESVVTSQTNITNTTSTEINKRMKILVNSNNEAIRLYNVESKYNKDIKNSTYATNLEASKKNLRLLVDELISMTSTTDEMAPDVKEAWINLAQGSREEYERAISTMPKTMQNKINEITATLRNDISVKDAVKYLGEEAVSQLNISSKFEEAGKNWIRGVSKGINNRLLRQEALSSMHSFGVEGLNAIRQQAWDEHSPSKETEKAAINLLKGIPKGINKEKSNTINNMLKFGQELMNKFNGTMSLNFNSLQNIPKLQNSISQTISTQLQPKILQPNIVINTQHLDNNEMNRIIDTVNRRFGMQI